MTAPPTPILKLTDIHKSYNVGTPVETEVLHGITLALREAEFVALKGPSGSGKSTLLNIIGLLERPTAGTLEIADQQTQSLDDAGLTRLRGATIGFVFQFHHLLPAFTALENVLLPSIIGHGTATPEAEALARELLARVGLKGAESKRPGELSGGMQQRVAIAPPSSPVTASAARSCPRACACWKPPRAASACRWNSPISTGRTATTTCSTAR
jgi:lipoprotein-releasing system ATP-binding protein